ncbi:acetate kinase, partial [Escherichia coli]|nr:acetate kinase [Escherichia coli]
SWKYQGEKTVEAIPAGGNHHQYAVERVVKLLETLGLSSKFVAVGHRIVAGGETFKGTVKVDETVIQEVERLAELAPLHNKANAEGMRAAMAAFPSLPQFAVFDTAFHQTMPEESYLYALPYNLYKEHGIRRYGMHGTSHLFITREVAGLLNKPV